MRPTRRLVELEWSLKKRLRRLRALEGLVGRRALDQAGRQSVAFITLELLNCWTEFSRSYFLSCSLNAVRLSGGAVATTNFAGATLNDAVGLVMAHFRPNVALSPGGTWRRRDEPTWHDPHVLQTSCSLLGASNLGQVNASLSVKTRVFVDLPVFRNFFAHRNAASSQSAIQLAKRYLIPHNPRPADVLRSFPANRPVSLLRDWIDDVEVVAELLCV